MFLSAEQPELKLLTKRQHVFIRNHRTTSDLLEWLYVIGLSVWIFACRLTSYMLTLRRRSTPLNIRNYSLNSNFMVSLDCSLNGASFRLSYKQNSMHWSLVSHRCMPFQVVCPRALFRLSPILLLAFINDFDYVCCGNTTLQLFACDAKLYSKVDVYNAFSSLLQALEWSKSEVTSR